jgi:hypothetical protein
MANSIVTLFSEQKIAPAGSPSMVASVFAHLATSGLLFVLMRVAVPHIVHVQPQSFSVVRLLNYDPSQSQASAGSEGLEYSANISDAAPSRAGASRPQRRVLPPNPKIKAGPQTILQAHPNHVPPPKHSVIPTVLLTAAHPKITQHIFTPPPRPNPSAPTPHMLTLPNAEIHVADIMLSSTDFPSPDFPIPASTTVPYKLDNPTDDAQIIQTTSPTQHAPSPTSLLALSDLQMVKGNIAIPQTENEVQKTTAKGSMTSGQQYEKPGTASTAKAGRSMVPAQKPNSGDSEQLVSKYNAGSHLPLKGAPGHPNPSQNSSAGDQGLAAATGRQPSTSLNGNGSGGQMSLTPITKSKTGQFGAVIMGNSAEQNFPETANLWTGRNAYTVYINVGTSTNWILQYSLPASSGPANSQATIGAPYPYAILRPNFPPSELNADALLVHGYIDATGKLVNATVEYPPDFGLAKQVLQALAGWQFRPATLNGKPTSVEVLFIIPNQPN